jgi:hypothetical protein
VKLNLLSKTGYQFSKFSLNYVFGAYINLKANTRFIMESGTEEIYEDHFQLIGDYISFKSVSLISSIEVGYKLTKHTEIWLQYGVNFLEGLNPYKFNLNNNLLTNFGLGNRQYLF